MTLHTPIARPSAAPAPSVADLIARMVQVGREAAALAHDCGAGTSVAEWRHVEACLSGLAERRPFEAIDEDALVAALGIVARDHDEDGNVYAVWAEVPAYTDRGGRLLEVQAKLREFAALRDRALDRLAAETALQDLRQA